ncbi:MAG: hypothetical protein IAF94_26650 [Pirellulaceae bacterium]|nr:hypothetical protein [Pirellulaceae bacterium]
MRAKMAVLAVLASLCLLLFADAAPPRRVKSKGSVAAVSPGKIMLLDAESKLRTFNIRADQNVVAVRGKLVVSDLKPGMLVRITGPLKGNAFEGETAAITVYSAADGYEPGIVRDSQDQPTVVTGVVKLLKDNALTILAGKKRITAKLAADVAVNVDSKDYSLAPAGSRIEADGYETKDGSVNAKKVVITIGEPSQAKPQDAKAGKSAKKKEEKK